MSDRGINWVVAAASGLVVWGCGGGEGGGPGNVDPMSSSSGGSAAGSGGTGGSDGLTGTGALTGSSGGTAASGGTDGSGGAIATGGAPGSVGTGGAAPPDPTCDANDPAEYALNAAIGGGNSTPITSAHFAIFGANNVDETLNFMEAAHQCFVQDWCWRTPGLSHRLDDGQRSKMNILVKVINAGGVMQYDDPAGLAYLEVNPNSIGSQHVVVHEFGHALTLTEYGWVNQANTGLWWESIANFVAESFANSAHCEGARSAHGIAKGRSVINLDAVIERSHLTMCNNSNQYEAWPFFTYLTNNPDAYAGLGKMIVPELFRNHLGNNETPLHVLERLASPISVQAILGRYWARMAYVDIGSPEAQEIFFDARHSLNFDILDSMGGNSYQVKANRRPRYAGANIIPLEVDGDGTVSVQVNHLGNGLDDSGFTATLSILTSAGAVRYVDLPGGVGQATVAGNEEVSLVVANTPESLYMYNPSDFGAAETSDPANTGLNYSVEITGATP